MDAQAPEQNKAAIGVLESLHGYASKLNDEARQTLETMNRDYVEKSRPVDEFLKLWDARLTTWEKFLRAYAMATPLDGSGKVAVETYLEAILEWVGQLRPPARFSAAAQIRPG